MEIHKPSKIESLITASSVRISADGQDSAAPSPVVSRATPHSECPAFPASPQTKPLAQSVSGVSAPELDPAEIVLFDEPFSGFGGHLFLYLCRVIEICFGRMRSKFLRQYDQVQPSFVGMLLKELGACSLGTICCIVIAAVLIPIFSGSSIKSFLPLPFLLIIVPVAFRFGRAAGFLGTIMAAFLFAYFLFEPQGLAVADPVARAHLIWMLIIGVVISDLLARWRAHRMHADKL